MTSSINIHATLWNSLTCTCKTTWPCHSFYKCHPITWELCVKYYYNPCYFYAEKNKGSHKEFY